MTLTLYRVISPFGGSGLLHVNLTSLLVTEAFKLRGGVGTTKLIHC